MSHEVGGIEGWFVRAWARLGVGTVLMHRTVFKMQLPCRPTDATFALFAS